MSWWVYKCNSRDHDYQRHVGDWEEFFSGGDREWGSTAFVSELGELKVGDMVFAYQTDRNELVGLTVVTQSCVNDGSVYLAPIIRFNGVKLRDLKERNKKIAAIPAFRSGPIQTIYDISEKDAVLLLLAAGRRSKAKATTRKAKV